MNTLNMPTGGQTPNKVLNQISIETYVDCSIVDMSQRDELINGIYENGAEVPNNNLSSGLTQPGWGNDKVIAKMGELDFSQGGFLLIENDLARPDMYESGEFAKYDIKSQDQLKILRKYFNQIGLNAETILSANAQKQIILFGKSINGYPVKSNF
jgi:hypothetical protein